MLSVTHDGQHWSNAEHDRVELLPYDPSWPALFDAEAAALRAQLAEFAPLALEHVGSTAIPGLAAKPIIDIVLILPDTAMWPTLIEPIQALGYVYWVDNPRQDRLFFVKGMPPFGTRRTHHVHVRLPDDAQAMLRFRDHLRAHADIAARYAALKYELAAQNPTNRDAYTEAKADFVSAVLRQAAPLR
jgi:GrpB-like predicted nucleotidyltransferase (UPF0157 family)